jgi:hypothetical protein
MAKCGQRRCLNCGEFFDPDCRNAGRQHYCSKPECRCASKAAAQAAWLAKPQNSDYFRDPSHVARVQAWRAAHPGYSRGRRKPSNALQEDLPVQAIDSIEETPNRSEIPKIPALQDSLPPLRANTDRAYRPFVRLYVTRWHRHHHTSFGTNRP